MTFTPDRVGLVSPAVVLLALGGPGIDYAAITLASLFKNSQLIITCFSGFFSLATYRGWIGMRGVLDEREDGILIKDF